MPSESGRVSVGGALGVGSTRARSFVLLLLSQLRLLSQFPCFVPRALRACFSPGDLSTD